MDVDVNFTYVFRLCFRPGKILRKWSGWLLHVFFRKPIYSSKLHHNIMSFMELFHCPEKTHPLTILARLSSYCSRMNDVSKIYAYSESGHTSFKLALTSARTCSKPWSSSACCILPLYNRFSNIRNGKQILYRYARYIPACDAIGPLSHSWI